MRQLAAHRIGHFLTGLALTCIACTALAEDEALRGQPVPEFDIVSLDQPDIHYSPRLLLGKPYLIDFWATWCSYCLAEMDNLHRVQLDFEPLGLQIISVSIDASIADVERFRRDRWPMPWIHANRTYTTEGSLATRFGVNGVPSTYLIDESGIVVAMDKQLRGEKLGKTLRRLLAQPVASP